MSSINNFLEGRFNAVRRDASYRPVIDKVKAEAKNGASSHDVLNVAMSATVDQFKRQGKKLDAHAVREAAFLAAAAASIEQPFEMKDMPAGDDKTKHFLTSGFLSVTVAKWADKVLPRGLAEKIGIGASAGLGWAKEVYDKFFGTGYNKDDLKADFAGAKRPFELTVPQEKP